uniref:Uncharacterized protein n=1 Tax=Cacopsylla melanoneura TaxID=428564 RepID=A0A8D8QMY4_9HEMI
MENLIPSILSLYVLLSKSRFYMYITKREYRLYITKSRFYITKSIILLRILQIWRLGEFYRKCFNIRVSQGTCCSNPGAILTSRWCCFCKTRKSGIRVIPGE